MSIQRNINSIRADNKYISVFEKCDLYSSHDGSVLRSASFHGTGGALSLANDWSDNELNYSYDDSQIPPPSSPQLVHFQI